MNQDWKQLTENFVTNEEEIRLLKNRIRKLFPNRNNLPKDLRLNYNNIFSNNSHNDILNLLADRTTQQFSSQIFPAILTRERATNFWFSGEPSIPLENEAWKGIYLLMSSVSVGDILINLENISEEGRIRWRGFLSSEDPGEFYKRIKTTFNLYSKNWGPFFIALLVISFFVFRIRENIQKNDLGLNEYLDELRKEYDITDETTLVIFQFGNNEKKEVHYFTKLTSFIVKWFKDYVEGREEYPFLVKFLDSLTTIDSRNKKSKVISSLREKFMFHLLRHNHINGKLLLQLVTIKVNNNLNNNRTNNKKVYGLHYSKQFFSKL